MATAFNLVKLPNATAATKTTTTPVTAAALTPKPVAGAAGAAMAGITPPTTPTTTVTAKTGTPVTASVLSGGKPVVTTGQTPPSTGQAPQGVQTPVTPSALAPQLSNAQNQYMSKFNGGTDGYIKSQLAAYQTAQPDMQAKIAADLQRFGVGVQGANGQQDGTGIDPNTGLPTWIGASEQDAINQQLAALQGQQQSAQQAAQFGVNQNNAYLQEQLQGLQGAEAVDNQSAQELQNRRGGFYSGGLDYQLGGIQSNYAQQRGALSRDIASRNQQLLDQYGTQANTIATQIKDLQTSAPEIIKQKINEYIDNQATFTGTRLGERTLAGQTQDLAKKTANLNAANIYSGLTGKVLSAQDDWSGLPRQVSQGVDSNGNPLQNSLLGQDQQFNQGITMSDLTGTLPNGQKTTQEQQRVLGNLWTVAQNTGTIPDQLADLYNLPYGTKTQAATQFAQTLALQQSADDLSWVREDYDQSQGQGTGDNGYKGLTSDQLLQSIKSNYTVQDPSTKKNRVTADPAKREKMFLDVIDSTAGMSDQQVTQLLRTLGLTSKEIDQFSKDNAGK